MSSRSVSSRQRFIVVGPQRSGTTVAYLALKGHPDVSGLSDEIKLKPFFTEGISAFTYGADTWVERARGHLALFDAITTVEAGAGFTAHGLKIALHAHEDAVELVHCLRTKLHSLRVIIVRREDLVAQCASWLRGEESGKWHSWTGARVGDATVMRIDPDYFTKYAVENLGMQSHLRTLADTHDVLELDYERDIVDGSGYGKMFEFLGLHATPVTWLRSRKVAPPPELFIENYLELRRMLDGMAAPSIDEEREVAQRRLHVRFEHMSDEQIAQDGVLTVQHRGIEAATIHVQVLNSRSPESPAAARLLGNIMHRRGDFRGAEEQYGRFLAAQPADVICHLHRAELRLKLDRPEGALEDIAAALHEERFHAVIRPTQVWAFEMLENSLTRMSDADLAKRTLDGIRADFERYPFFHYLQGMVCLYLGDREGCIASLRRAVELGPNDERARERLASLIG